MTNSIVYLSWSGRVSFHAVQAINESLKVLYGDECRTYWSSEIGKGRDWFQVNEEFLARAKHALVVVCLQGLTSHWQAYEFGRLFGHPGFSPNVLLVDLETRDLAGTVYNHVNCSTCTPGDLYEVLVACNRDLDDKIQETHVRTGATELFGRLQSLKAASSNSRFLKKTYRRRLDAVQLEIHIQRVVDELYSAGLRGYEIKVWLDDFEIIPASYVEFLRD